MKQNKYDVVCAGVALADLIIKGFDPTPVSAGRFLSESAALNVGGEALNAAVTAARLGLCTGILCFLGSDSVGQIIEKALTENGVDITSAVRAEGIATPITTMFVDENGDRKSIMSGSHKYNFHPEEHTDILSATKAVTLGSLFRAPFAEPEAVQKFLLKAKENDVLIFADTKLPNFWPLTLSDFKDVLPLIDYIFPNEDEACHYTGETEPEKCSDVFLSHGVKNVIVKLGSRGCLLKNERERIFMPAFKIDAVDATGAGDNFMAGFIKGVLSGYTHEGALEIASACGAICTQHVGAINGAKSFAEVEKFAVRSGLLS